MSDAKVVRCGAEEAPLGPEALPLLRPGAELAGRPVPRALFHDWVGAVGVRLLQRYAAFAQVEEHELRWLVDALAAIRVTREPQPADRAEREELRQGLRMIAATLGPLPLLHGRKPAMQAIVGWVQDAASWATKRHLLDRRCPHEPPSLLARAAAIHGDLEERAGGSRAAAEAAERDAQLADFDALLREP